MKNFKITSIALLIGLVVLAGCKPDPVEPSPEEVQTALLIGTWSTSSVNFQGSADQGDWTGFSLTLTDGGYSTSGVSEGRELVWPSTGTWSYKEGGVSTLVRNDLVEMGVTVNATDLTLTFTYDEATNNGKTNGVDGSWVFTMTK